MLHRPFVVQRKQKCLFYSFGEQETKLDRIRVGVVTEVASSSFRSFVPNRDTNDTTKSRDSLGI